MITANNHNPPGAYIDPQMMVQQAPQMDAQDRRRLVKDIKDEVKPMIAQIADYQIEKANAIIKTQIRKIEND